MLQTKGTFTTVMEPFEISEDENMISSVVWHQPRVAAKLIDDELEAATRFNGSDDDSDTAKIRMASPLQNGVSGAGSEKRPRPYSMPNIVTQPLPPSPPHGPVWQQKPVCAAANTTVLPDMAL